MLHKRFSCGTHLAEPVMEHSFMHKLEIPRVTNFFLSLYVTANTTRQTAIPVSMPGWYFSFRKLGKELFLNFFFFYESWEVHIIITSAKMKALLTFIQIRWKFITPNSKLSLLFQCQVQNMNSPDWLLYICCDDSSENLVMHRNIFFLAPLRLTMQIM